MSSLSNKNSIHSGPRGGGKLGSRPSSGMMNSSSSRMPASSMGGGGGRGGSLSTSLTGDQLEKRIQANFHKATRDRDNAHRQLVVATQRLSAAKSEVKVLRKNINEERQKHSSTRNELERTKVELEMMEISVDNLKRKVKKRNDIIWGFAALSCVVSCDASKGV